MNKKNFSLNNMKEKLPWIEKLTRRYMVERLTMVAILVGAFSAWMHLFIGTFGWCMLFLVIGSAVGIFFPHQMDRWVRKVYSFSRSGNHMSTVVAESAKIALALFLPFVYFAFLGVLAGTAYQYYVQSAQAGNKDNKAS